MLQKHIWELIAEYTGLVTPAISIMKNKDRKHINPYIKMFNTYINNPRISSHKRLSHIQTAINLITHHINDYVNEKSISKRNIKLSRINSITSLYNKLMERK